jgi:hypothetical protein
MRWGCAPDPSISISASVRRSGAWFACIGIFLIVAIGIGLSVTLGTLLSGGNSDSSLGWIVSAILIVALICLAILTFVRMGYLIVPSIVSEPGRGGLARSYHLTRGNFWRIVLIVIVAALPIWMVQSAVQTAFLGNAMSTFFTDFFQTFAQPGVPDPNAFNAAYLRFMEAMHEVLLPVTLIGWVASIFLTGLIYTGAAYAYRALAAAPQPVPASAA